MTLAASLANVPRFRDLAERACARAGMAADDCFGLKLAIDEVCTNIIEHGYGPDGGGEISLTIEIGDREARMTVVDRGRPFSPDQAATPELGTHWEDRPIGGLGWHLVRSVVDEIRYERDGSENRLTLIKKLEGGTGTSQELE